MRCSTRGDACERRGSRDARRGRCALRCVSRRPPAAPLYRGDIDNVLGKALEKDPGRRYASVTALTDDIRRFLHHEPLSVHGQAWSYRDGEVRPPASLAGGGRHGRLCHADRRTVSWSTPAADRGTPVPQLRHLSQQVFDLDDRNQDLAGATEARQALVAASLRIPRRGSRATRAATSI